ncbi:MAG: formaldehyde-activating enzyme [Candidatus Altiarchaeales archaeon]|nr:MAG: formaldehyde-activating enzyme [Candidatus Altiarchaeales archaeon]RLI95349.1 MAG: formaldehyde-activating enzyme [Candidatus Altiarchaeales archaeon]HDO82561.1 bifunctional 5,6,7,8-tetrahydromethanopterin hydro-lyase/3-hexulose-6-phosphate synthase [Candidatus Altiarchaeales archaeon]HEX55210.1 bifunctional 5,6,7,8-tetrahydromethanopterin hydro-lyase/3-hexulose-6-phosphate synthase [Candidatus Altiarchaeales archaeon]
MFKIGEALVGKGNEVAHVDLIIGDKEGYVGQAFANSLSHLSAGHTPLLSVIRPNLPAKPYTLVIPKVTVEDMDDAVKIFGPAQAAVAKAVADAVEEGIIPKEKIEDWVIIASVFIHPDAKDFRKIYQYNYGATKLALKRALQDYPSLEKIMYDKDRAVHPIMGFRVPRLPRWNRPYLQIALDIPDLERTKQILREIPKSDKIILEAGTPLIKKYGTKVINELREVAKSEFMIADLKTLDVGQVEVDVAFDEGADGVVASGLATPEVIDKFIYEAKRLGIYAIVDMMNVEDPVKKLKSLKELPDIVIIHRAIDSEKTQEIRWQAIKEIRKEFGDKIMVAVAGGIEPDTVPVALKQGADIIIVGRFITQSKDIERSTRLFINLLGGDIDLKRVHVE